VSRCYKQYSWDVKRSCLVSQSVSQSRVAAAEAGLLLLLLLNKHRDVMTTLVSTAGYAKLIECYTVGPYVRPSHVLCNAVIVAPPRTPLHLGPTLQQSISYSTVYVTNGRTEYPSVYSTFSKFVLTDFNSLLFIYSAYINYINVTWLSGYRHGLDW
jgi:hypothetical protein